MLSLSKSLKTHAYQGPVTSSSLSLSLSQRLSPLYFCCPSKFVLFMKRSRSFAEGQRSGEALPHRPPLSRSSLSMDLLCAAPSPGFAPSDAAPAPLQPRSNSTAAPAHDSPSESASSRETWPTEHTRELHSSAVQQQQQRSKTMNESDCVRPEPRVMHRVGSSDRLQLREVAFGHVDVVAARMQEMAEELSEDLKAELRGMLNGTGGVQQREEFAFLQKQVLSRRDLTPESLAIANRTQLEILVAIKTGIPAFLHPDISVTQSILIEIFFHKRCRNMACQNLLPGDDCTCEVCTSKIGFCNTCMCTICSKFDFDVNTCRWIGCDFCSHWAHTDCAIRVGQIAMGPLSRGEGTLSGMLFKCGACKKASELLGWVKDVFCTCAGDWGGKELLREFDSVHRIFYGSEDAKGKKLFRKSEEVIEKLRSGVDASVICKEMRNFFEALEAEDMCEHEGKDTKLVEPVEACSRIAEVVQEAITKMDIFAEEKARALKKARLALETCDRELEEKRRELQELQTERHRKEQQIDELESIVRLRMAEADMFQNHADKARHEADELQRIALEKSEKVEEEYTARYLKLRLDEVEAERRALFEKIQMQEVCRLQPDASQMRMVCKIQDLLKRVYNKNEPADSNGPTL